MPDADPTPPSRRAVWIVRLVFYPLAIGLVVLAWHQRHAGARTPHVPTWTHVDGTTGQGRPTTVRSRDGVPFRISFAITYDCTPGLGWVVWAHYALPRVEVAGGRLHAREEDVPTEWANGWYGTATVSFDGRYDHDRVTGSLSARMRLDANGIRTDCRADDVSLDLTRGGRGEPG